VKLSSKPIHSSQSLFRRRLVVPVDKKTFANRVNPLTIHMVRKNGSPEDRKVIKRIL